MQAFKRTSDDTADTRSALAAGIASVRRARAKNDEWGTPPDLFAHYDRLYKFDLDVAASGALAKCKRYYSRTDDGLKQEWSGTVWMNPPYSKLTAWRKKAHESAKCGTVVVALLPVFTDSVWFHECASHAEIELLRGRLQFGGGDGFAPMANMIAVWRGQNPPGPAIGYRLPCRIVGQTVNSLAIMTP